MTKRKLDTKPRNVMVMDNGLVKAIYNGKMNTYAMKLLRVAITQCRMDDTTFYTYETDIKTLQKLFGTSSKDTYKRMDEATGQCMGTYIKAQKSGSKSFKKYTIFEQCEYIEGTGKVIMRLSKSMKPLLLDLNKKNGGNFTKVPLGDVLTMRGKYSIRIYEILLEELRSKKIYSSNSADVYLNLEELRVMLSLEKTYKQIGQFKDRVLNPVVKEINESDIGWHVLVEDVKSGRSITGFNFHIESKLFHELPKNSKFREMTPEEIKEYSKITRNSKQMEMIL